MSADDYRAGVVDGLRQAADVCRDHARYERPRAAAKFHGAARTLDWIAERLTQTPVPPGSGGSTTPAQPSQKDTA